MKLVSFALVIFALLTDYAFADETYRLKAKVEISGPTVSLADVIDGPDLPHDPVFRSPDPGQAGTIQATRIAAAFKTATGKTLTLTQDKAVTVTRRAKLIAEGDVALEISRLIARDFKIEDPEVRLEFDETRNLAVDETATGTLRITNLRLDPQSLRFEAQLNVADLAGSNSAPIPLKGYVLADRLVPVIARQIDKGMPVTAGDIRMERRLRQSLLGKTIVALQELQHQVALMPLAAGDVVTDERVGKPVLIEKGSAVTVSYESNGLLLTMRGRATESGSMGDVIGFSNPQSKKILFGTVSGDGALRVTSSAMKEARLKTDAASDAQ